MGRTPAEALLMVGHSCQWERKREEISQLRPVRHEALVRSHFQRASAKAPKMSPPQIAMRSTWLAGVMVESFCLICRLHMERATAAGSATQSAFLRLHRQKNQQKELEPKMWRPAITREYMPQGGRDNAILAFSARFPASDKNRN